MTGEGRTLSSERCCCTHLDRKDHCLPCYLAAGDVHNPPPHARCQAKPGRVYSSDVRTLTTYEAYCSCGWSVVRSTWDDASKAVDKHDERHEEQR